MILIDASGNTTIANFSEQEYLSLGAPYAKLTSPTKLIDLLKDMFGHSKSEMQRSKRKLTVGGLPAELNEELQPGNCSVVVVYGKERGVIF